MSDLGSGLLLSLGPGEEVPLHCLVTGGLQVPRDLVERGQNHLRREDVNRNETITVITPTCPGQAGQTSATWSSLVLFLSEARCHKHTSFSMIRSSTMLLNLIPSVI